jgi:putative two-component system response regulator
LPGEKVELIQQAAPLHDVGKIAISDLVLLKRGKLTDEEYATMQSHAARGAALLSEGRSEVVQMAERIAGAHQERWDGKGYP